MRFDFGKCKRSYSVSANEGKCNAVFTCHSVINSTSHVIKYNDEERVNDNNEVFVINPINNAIKSESENDEGCDFETAIQATKYGKYNWFLLSIGLWGYISAMCAVTAVSLILPSIGCDMKLNNFHKGMLNGSVFVGMVLTAFFWGLVSDAIGRRTILLFGFAADALFCIVMGLSPSFTFLLVSKFLSGFINSSLIVILSSFVAENHASRYRASVIVGMGMFSSVGTAVLPLLAWIILPLPIHIIFFDGLINLTSWKIFLLITSIPSILAFVSIIFVKESPKFLMFQNRNEEALNVFRKIYTINTGDPADKFPIKRLKAEPSGTSDKLENNNFSIKKILTKGWEQAMPIFHKPYLLMGLIPCTMQFCTILSMNTIRLWSPELFAWAFEHGNLHNDSQIPSNICDLIAVDSAYLNASQVNLDCNEKTVDKEIYFDSMIMGIVTGVGFLFSGYIVKLIDIKWLMIIIYGLSIAGCIALYWCSSTTYLLAIVSIFVAITTIAATAISSVIISTFPTSLRTTTLSICLSFGRTGAMIGNLVFPILLDWNCLSPFIFLAFSLGIAGLLAFLLPKTKGKSLT